MRADILDHSTENLYPANSPDGEVTFRMKRSGSGRSSPMYHFAGRSLLVTAAADIAAAETVATAAARAVMMLNFISRQ